MKKFKQLQSQHEELIRAHANEDVSTLVKNYIEEVKLSSSQISSAQERDQLRANLRYWASYIFEKTGTYPNIDLAPPVLFPTSNRWMPVAVLVIIAAIVVTSPRLAKYFIPSTSVTAATATSSLPVSTFTFLAPTNTLSPMVGATDTLTQESISTETSVPNPTSTETLVLTSTSAGTSPPSLSPTATISSRPVVYDPHPNPSSDYPDTLGVPMVLVPPGDFTMGSERGNANEKPVHKVTLDAFFIDKYEVTNIQYKRCVDIGVCQSPEHAYSYAIVNYYDNPKFDNYPVLYVDWNQAQTFCKWRGARLPTEAEWEKTARGTDGRIYPWGDEFNGSNLNFCDADCRFEWANKSYKDGYLDTAPVGTFTAGVSPYGAYDMAGNVSEWVADWYSSTYYETSPLSNPLGPDGGVSHVLRGGSWINTLLLVRTTYRGVDPNFSSGNTYGFRCARTP